MAIPTAGWPLRGARVAPSPSAERRTVSHVAGEVYFDCAVHGEVVGADFASGGQGNHDQAGGPRRRLWWAPLGLIYLGAADVQVGDQAARVRDWAVGVP